MSSAWEVNFDGLIGPTHNYGGLSDGNLASANNAGDISNPREAALQGLEKMRKLLRSGLKQGFLPPLLRPNLPFLQCAGFSGTVEEIITQAGKDAPALLKAAYSASSMWAANAATVSPSADTEDGRLHLTPANLSTMLHRSLEHPDTLASLRSIFDDPAHFAVHEALPEHPDFSDEGAANDVRLCAGHGDEGVELFVFGREASESTNGFPARQTRLASERIAAMHGVKTDRAVFVRQSVAAINAGAFHNDVVCVGTLDTLFTHELAFEDKEAAYQAISDAANGLFELKVVEVPQAEVPIEDAIRSYLFNSQLLSMPGEDRLVLLAPLETQETESTRTYCERLTPGNGPIGRVEYVDVRQSMRNGGGPACLRLRVVMTNEELEAVNPAFLLDESKIDKLQDWVRAHYRDALSASDFADPALASEIRNAHLALLDVINSFSN
ncbi:N-succinylarginine dihydrolase [Ponticaulis sp.]|uniref:N-succinylarginine dihydrolase n=1 Tax=Ponticaulis sp. TaxID=2020902 RepID=UPI000B66CBB9|nr:N-succinylarginine dihydrolase [Ponticaulis sp.]MAI91557.1 succinylarginine dihydrolase [Ponticaulis sp.]OUX97512.1 MAG: succinylarginine dihydrolase [Hyphomonadaceae bacterium TMED5]|tara:strand:+ start:14842 stop:16161 length:1320 start_codon:yes stop_codon:yes gene_type:complete